MKVVIPIYREGATVRYSAPAVFIEHDNEIDQLSLARFEGWSFHAHGVMYVKKGNGHRPGDFWKKDPNSNRSKKRAKRNFTGSRPERRHANRLAIKIGGYNAGKISEGKKPGAAKYN